ncbi:NAD(P)-binding protein [Dichomitus squalens]|uniref:NAD(P)-binding protein n=1 Tax=Dichomitus squalens TaxID=114155 RepID=A0A4Q9P7E6_9APHY|nr:NAD(P)-binding protein [Dichomitus squalens]TBU59411.1 NAD(P)-binding protein [Dichomitus squalens]
MARVIVTGASGVLGSAVYAAFKSAGHTVLGLAHSRPTDELKKLDLLDEDATESYFAEFKPDWVIHCAAERRPDVAEKDPEAARKINVSVPEHLANLSKKLKFKLVYISTDYVFDGTSPPYPPSARTNPLNLYGTTKRDGELAVLGVSGSQSIVLRVPVLYGPAPNNTDSAVNILLNVVADRSGKQYKMDHYATRFPTNVLDIADFLARLINVPPTRAIPPILHYSAAEPFTKYEMCLIFAKILGVPHGHIIPDAEPPKDGTPRPQNTQLYVHETEDLMEGFGGLGWNPFEEWWTEYLKKSQ